MRSYAVLKKEDYKSRYSYNLSERTPYEMGIPLVDMPDKAIEKTYYFRWHTYCKHIRKTPEGFVVTEFFPDVPWAGKFNAIPCPAMHQFYEGRWLYDTDFLKSYAEYWFSKGADPRKYSFPIAHSVYAFGLVTGDFSVAEKLYEKLKENYAEWEKDKGSLYGMFYQIDNFDGMEFSAGGSGLRPTINSYMYADAAALSKIAERKGLLDEAEEYKAKAEALKKKINELLWDEKAEFFKTLNVDTKELVDVREQVGFVPWYYSIPSEEKSIAWKFLNDENHFAAPFGPTTTERCSPLFMQPHNHECLWNGPSWPFATCQTLTAMANLLNDYDQMVVTSEDYCSLLSQYAGCHKLTEDGKTVPFIDENLDPFTGEWLARKILKNGFKGHKFIERGKDYNHSTFCDLVLSGLAGIRIGEGDKVTVNPLFTDTFDYFCADGVLYHGKFITVLWDKTGERYNKGKGFKVLVDGEQVFEAEKPQKAEIKL